jgi:stearoyl-CoA desaturase (delta-9 desaturase)
MRERPFAPAGVSWTTGTWAFMLLHASALLAFRTGWSPVAIAAAVAAYWARMFGITAGFHRYFAHASYRTSRWFQFALAWLGASAAQKGPLWWAGHHRNHHLHSDTVKDIHSPMHGGFWWSHIGWILSERYDAIEWGAIKEFARFPELRFIDAKAWLPPTTLAAGMWALGAALAAWAPSLRTSGPQMLVWGFSISTIVLYHATFSINSLAHVWGERRYQTDDDSRNNLWLALLTMGEGWHNNHHRCQYSARQGFFWWEADMTHYALTALSELGVVWGLRAPPREVFAEAASGATAASAGDQVVRGLVYASAAGEPLAGDLHLPAGSGPFPVVLVVHGGGWTSRSRSDMTSVSKRLADAGYAAFNIDYRKAPRHLYPAAVDDCREAVRWLRAHASEHRLDPTRIAAFGYSSGAHLAALIGYDSRVDSPVQALVLGGTPADLRVYPNSPLVRGFLGKRLADDPSLYARASPITFVAAGGPPTFIYHGRQDLLVEVEQARALKKALDEAGVEAELYEASPATHYTAFLFNGRSIDRAIRFLDGHLKAATAEHAR